MHIIPSETLGAKGLVNSIAKSLAESLGSDYMHDSRRDSFLESKNPIFHNSEMVIMIIQEEMLQIPLNFETILKNHQYILGISENC